MLTKYIITLITLALGISASTSNQRDVKVLAGAPINSLNLTVTPDSPIEGQNVTLDWGYGDAGTAPYNIQIGTGGYYSNLTWLYSYTNLSETIFNWTVNVTAGETLVFQLWDATNTTTYTQNHLILPNNATTSENSTSSDIIPEPTESHIDNPDEDIDESFLGELLAEIESELDG